MAIVEVAGPSLMIRRNGVLIPGAVPMHALGEMGDKAAGRHRRAQLHA